MLYISHLLPDEEMREVLEQTGAGVESIEFSISENLDHLSESIVSYRKRMQVMGTDKLTVHGPFLDLNPMTFDSEIRRVTKLRYDQAYTAAQELGAEKIIYHTCMYPTIFMLQGWAERVTDFFREFTEEKKGLEIVLENVFDRIWEPILKVVQNVSNPKLHLCLDIGHAHCFSEKPVEEWAKAFSPYVSHLHVHDNTGDRDAHLALGRGNIPLDAVFSALNGRYCSCTIECSSKEAVLESAAWLKNHENKQSLQGRRQENTWKIKEK